MSETSSMDISCLRWASALTESRVKALQEAREPKNSSEVKGFLGLVNFSARYISERATKTQYCHNQYSVMKKQGTDINWYDSMLM